MTAAGRCIVTSSDAKYFPALMALLRSLKATNPGIPVTVFDGGLTSRQARKASRLARVVRKQPFVELEGKGKFSYIGSATLLKFEAAQLDHEKVLYLDADMVVLEDLEELFSFPCGSVGVVPEVNAVKNMFRPRHRQTLAENINIDWNAPGFNAGLFALRPAEWRDLPERALALIESFGPEVFSKTKDQQLLNIIFAGKTFTFPGRYNFSPFYDKAEEAPAIVHYLTALKPWHRDYPLGHFYSEFRENISFADYPEILLTDLYHYIGTVSAPSKGL
jgi:lipopolysaccharide biosynthesis glycosyltransferase